MNNVLAHIGDTGVFIKWRLIPIPNRAKALAILECIVGVRTNVIIHSVLEASGIGVRNRQIDVCGKRVAGVALTRTSTVDPSAACLFSYQPRSDSRRAVYRLGQCTASDSGLLSTSRT